MNNDLMKEALSTLSSVDDMSLHEFADYLEQQADFIRNMAVQNSLTREDKNAAGMRFIQQSPRIVSRYLLQGHSLEEAIEKTATKTGAPVTAIENAWRRFSDSKNEHAMRQRNRLLIELASAGMSNAEIGHRLNLHYSSVARLIAKARRMNFLALPDTTQSVSKLKKRGDDDVF
jgi:DNA-binding NarL/FixJ family response regulator